MSDPSKVSRREMLVQGGTAMAGMALFPYGLAAELLKIVPQEALIPWLDRPPEPPPNVNTLDWEALESWVTPNDQHFRVGHYGTPEIAESDWSLEIAGMVDRPLTFSLAELKRRPRQEVTFSLECAGNRGFPSFWGAIYNARFAGTPLASVLREAGIQDGGIEIVFIGSDTNDEEIRGNTVNVNFGRSMSVEDAMDSNLILCYEVNGEPLGTEHGFPLRLIAPGWYGGIANVKWLKRIEVRDTRYMGRFMAQDYVTLRGEERNGKTVFVQTSVGLSNVNSIPAKVTVDEGRFRIHGRLGGGPSSASKCRSTEATGIRRRSATARTAPSHGRTGSSTGTRRTASTRSRLGQSPQTARCSRRRRIPRSRTSGPTGRAAGRSRGA